VTISEASTDPQIARVRALFEEYAAWLGVDLCFQRFTEELASLPGLYARPRGRLFLGLVEDEPAGCVGVRPISAAVCEMKRLYVRPKFQHQGFGRKLAEQAITEARSIGYSSMTLDTLPRMGAAIVLYTSLGFIRRNAYYETPMQGTVFMELALQ